MEGCNRGAVRDHAGLRRAAGDEPRTRTSKSCPEAFEINTLGAWRICQSFIQRLRKSKHARLVNVSSESGSLTLMGGGTPGYNVSKVALNALTRMLTDELSPARILCNSVCPGRVATDMGGPQAPRTVEEGAASVVWAATLSDDGPTGGFFRGGGPLPW